MTTTSSYMKNTKEGIQLNLPEYSTHAGENHCLHQMLSLELQTFHVWTRQQIWTNACVGKWTYKKAKNT